jgi:hypothetical protein
MAWLRLAGRVGPLMDSYVVSNPVPLGHQAAGAQPGVPFVARRLPVEVQTPIALREQWQEKG